ncbi:MAG: hypothetical protein H6R04_475 [Burkholderiaceae bacterium]|nr:hypothetical protein [Burkholderiaceae bacterium]
MLFIPLAYPPAGESRPPNFTLHFETSMPAVAWTTTIRPHYCYAQASTNVSQDKHYLISCIESSKKFNPLRKCHVDSKTHQADMKGSKKWLKFNKEDGLKE